MATVTSFLTGQAIAPAQPIGNQEVIAENILDFTVTNAGSADVVQAIKLPANAIVTEVKTEVITAEGSAGNFDIGDGSDVDGWDVDVDVNSAAGIIAGNGAYAGGKRYSSADTIDIIPSIALDAAKIYVMAKYYVRDVS